MDTDIRDALAKSLPDLALIVRRDGVILSCVGGHAVRGLNPEEKGLPGRAIDTVWPEGIATHALQTVRRILKTRKTAQQRYQEGDVKLEMRFQVQGFDRVLIVCRDLGQGHHVERLRPLSDSAQSTSAMLPHREGFEKSLRMALDMAALREDTVGVALIHIGGYCNLSARVRLLAREPPARVGGEDHHREPPRRSDATCRASRASRTTSSASCSPTSVRAATPTPRSRRS